MRKMATQDAVFDAARQLVTDGREPSSRAVRDALGGGSLATIQRYLRAWRGVADPDDGGDPQPMVDGADIGDPRFSTMRPARARSTSSAGPSELPVALDARLDDMMRAVMALRADIAATDAERAAGAEAANERLATLLDAVAASRTPSEVPGSVQALRDDHPSATDRALAAEVTALLPLLRDVLDAVQHPAAPVEDTRIVDALQGIELLRTELRLATLALRPLQEELARLRNDRDRLLGERARVQAERDAAVAEVSVYRQILALRDDDRHAMTDAAAGALGPVGEPH